MKHTLIAILFFATVACQNNNGTSGKTGLVDSAYTVVLYGYLVPMGDFRTGLARRWVYDTIAPDPADKTRNKVVRDTSYSILVKEEATDSLGNILKRPNGRDSIIFEWRAGRNKKLIVKDYGYDWREINQAQMEQLNPPKK